MAIDIDYFRRHFTYFARCLRRQRLRIFLSSAAAAGFITPFHYYMLSG